MKAKLSTVLFFIIIINFARTELYAQGISRSSGLGVRLSFWNITSHPTRINISDHGGDANVDVSGAGAWLYYFSRMHQNLFLEFSLGAVGGVHQKQSNYIVEELDASAVVPLLFGLRYDLLSTRFPSKIQPYLSIGAGPYWTSSAQGSDIDYGGETVISSNLLYGMYTGGGINIVPLSWMAINFDLKYHYVDFKFEDGYSGLEFAMGFSLMWGHSREIFQIKEVRPIVNDIYPAYYQFYNTYPLALVRIENIAGYPIEVNIKSRINDYSERLAESGFINIPRGETKDLPVTAMFGSKIQQVTEREQTVLDIIIEVRAGQTVTKALSTALTLHSRNSWNGDMEKLRYFITPDNREIFNLSRSIVDNDEIKPDKIQENFHNAKTIFNELSRRGVSYHKDPNITFYKDDRVQYSTETLNLGGGDCDDLVVLYASLLESLGINSAFIEVKDPQKEIAHLYLMFDSGLEFEQGYLISSNTKRFIVHENSSGSRMIWIPVETTLIEEGFEAAWNVGALAYLQEGIVRNGIAEGWVRIIELE